MKLESSTPPPLCHSPLDSDRGRESTAESTPVTTPVEPAVVEPVFGRLRKTDPLHFSWQPKPHEPVPCDIQLEPDLLFEDTGDCSFPLFPDSPPQHSYLRDMAQAASPIDIATPPRFGSNSPQNQTSNLTSALREAGAGRNNHLDAPSTHQNGQDLHRPSLSARNDSMSGLGGSFYGSGARPISMKDRPRRESNAMNSLVNGLSWGGVSVGSWIRDE